MKEYKAKSFEVEIDGKKEKVVRWDAYTSDVDSLYGEMKEAKRERDVNGKKLKETSEKLTDVTSDVTNLNSRIEKLSTETNKEELDKAIKERDDLKKKLEKSVSEVDIVKTKLKNVSIDNVLKTSLIEAGAHPDYVNDAMLIARARVNMNDEFNAEIVGESGERITNAKGDPLSLKEYAEEFIKSKQHFAKPDFKPGSGMSKNDNSGSAGRKWTELSETEKNIEYKKARDTGTGAKLLDRIARDVSETQEGNKNGSNASK